MSEIPTSNYNNPLQAQLSFVYDAVLETSIEGTGQVNAQVFASSYNKWKQIDPKTKKACLKMQLILGKSAVLSFITFVQFFAM